ncbi:hypothetical protein [Endozoicomonas sp. 8E]|uniref:hypothetical protein n=1 Tax=Endozoicomonas sp. 8E TaxID=3035692 RepID=UPI002938F366|nr:hypothetical protein [Endozoicomonas sp. 8E]WOG29401.1 hypothetical protein P6910_07065 [Endozoicomonas sp. 8E]
MDAGHNKLQTGALPPGPMDTGGISQSSVLLRDSATFNARNVTRADNPSCKLTVYLDYGHSFVRLENKARGVDIARGLYPVSATRWEVIPQDAEGSLDDHELDSLSHSEVPPADPPLPRDENPDPVDEVPEPFVAHNQCPVREVVGDLGRVRRLLLASAVSGGAKLAGRRSQGKVSCSVGVGRYSYEILSKTQQGAVLDEAIEFKTYYHNDINDIPKVTFFISQQEAIRVEKYISEYADACDKGEESCIFQGLGFNCVDFAQEAFSKTGYPGHFIQYFTSSLLDQHVGLAGLYAGSYHPVVKTTTSIGGTLMLVAIVGKYVPKLTEAVRSVGSWMCGWVWPEQQAVAATKVDVSELKQLHSRLQSANLSCEAFWESYEASDAQAKKLISDSVDLQARFDYVEKLIKTEGYDGEHQSFINKELQSIRGGFTEFFRKANEIKNAQ